MQAYLKNFLTEYGYLEEDSKVLLGAYEKICNAPKANLLFSTLLKGYETHKRFTNPEQLFVLEEIATDAGVHLYTVELVAVLCLSKTLQARMQKMEIPEEIIRTTFQDFKIKLGECKEVRGVVGTICWAWYCRFFALQLFGMGRLQFEITQFSQEYYEKNGKSVKKGDTVLSVHIPKTGEPLDEQACEQAYRQAKEFFATFFGLKDVAYICASWLLFPLNAQILPEYSNIRKFGKRYDVIMVEEYPADNDPVVAILFGVPMVENTDALPQNSALQRGYAKHIEEGKLTGYGYGVFFLKE